jgi:hypothetical protein
LQIPLPTTPVLEGMVKVELNFQGNRKPEADVLVFALIFLCTLPDWDGNRGAAYQEKLNS